jgi:hypothetical protein
MTPYQRISLRNWLFAAAPWLNKLVAWKRAWKALGVWEREGWVNPPPYFVRLAMLETQAKELGAEAFIETGTFRGDTTWFFRNRFRKIVTIEVQEQLVKIARKRFRRHHHVEVIHGDSANELAAVCTTIDGPCLVFLDGHYSAGITSFGEKECPAIEELHALFSHLKHPFRIVIDDAREFGNDPAYPELAVISEFLRKQSGKWEMKVENDAILIWNDTGAGQQH